MKKATVFVLTGIIAFLLMIPSRSQGQTICRIRVRDGGATIYTTQVMRYDSLYGYLDSRYTTNPPGYAEWNPITPGRYNFEAYDSVGRGIWGTNAYWGSEANVRVLANTTKYDTVNRTMPYIQAIQLLDGAGNPVTRVRPGTTVYFTARFYNPGTVACTCNVEFIADRSRSSPWDWSGPPISKTIVNPGNTSAWIGTSWSIPTNQAQGTYYISYRGNGRNRYMAGWSSIHQVSWRATLIISGVEETNDKLNPSNERKFTISPNPLSRRAELFLTSKTKGSGKVEVYNIAGKRVEVLEIPTNQIAIWDGRKLPAGVYFLRATAGDFTATEKVVITR